MNNGMISAILGIFQIVCVVIMFSVTGKNLAIDIILLLAMVMSLISSTTFSAMSFWKNEKPIAWAITGLGISVFWVIWVIVAPLIWNINRYY